MPAFANPLHIRCGDDILPLLETAGLPGRTMSWCHLICDGCLPSADDDAPLLAYRAHDAVVLWFEHDLFDQAILIRLLAWFHEHAPELCANQRLHMVTIDRFPGIDRFIGLGQLTPAQLATLYASSSAPVTSAQLHLAVRAWQAWSTPDHAALATLAGETALPYLGSAIRRRLQELPAPGTGLTLTHTYILDALGQGPLDANALFLAVQDREAAPWRGDLMFYDVLATAPGIECVDGRWRLTADGRRLQARG